MHIIIPSDVFPPGSVGGAAWSAHTLARALMDRGHIVAAVVPTQQQRSSMLARFSYDLPYTSWNDVFGVPTLRWSYHAPPIPILKNYYRHERLWQQFSALLSGLAANINTLPIIHAQHVQTAPAAVMAGQRLGTPVVVTVRDHWPWDYFATGLHSNRLPYPGNTWQSLITDLPGRIGAVPGILALPAVPYMLAHVRRRATYLAQADAVIAVSSYIARRLHDIVPAERIHVIPNMIDIDATERIAAMPPQTPISGPFLLYVGKLEHNKLGNLLLELFRALASSGVLAPGSDCPVPKMVLVGSGSLQPALERQVREIQRDTGVDLGVHFLSWASHDEVLRLMARCDLLLFPSAWGEPLSRVLLEASALGAPILAMPTGGTSDIISDGVNGVLARTPEQFARKLIHLLNSPHDRMCLGEHAREIAQTRFSVDAVAPRLEQLYATVSHRYDPHTI